MSVGNFMVAKITDPIMAIPLIIFIVTIFFIARYIFLKEELLENIANRLAFIVAILSLLLLLILYLYDR